jgi:ribosome biogenesis GTPase A
MDTLPEEAKVTYLEKNIKEQISKLIEYKNYKVIFVSAKTQDGLRELTNLLIEESKERRDRGEQRRAFLIGNANTGKSSLINALKYKSEGDLKLV